MSPLGTQITGGITPGPKLTGGVQAATKLAGAIRLQNSDYNVVIIEFDDGGVEWFESIITPGANVAGLLLPTAGLAITPRIKEMMAKGVFFTRAEAHPICGPSRRALQTGRYGFRVGLAGNIEDTNAGYLFGGTQSVGVVTPTQKLIGRAVRLGRNGTADQTLGQTNFSYALGWFGKSHLCSSSGVETYQVDQGYGRYVGCQPNAASLLNWPAGQAAPNVTPATPTVDDANAGHYHFREITHAAGSSYTTVTYGTSAAWVGGGANTHYVAYDSGLTPKAAWDAYKVFRDATLWINTRTSPFVALIAFNPPHAPFEVPPYTAPNDVGSGAPGGTIDLIGAGTQAAMTALDGGAKGPGYRPSSTASIQQVFRANIEAIDTLIGMLWDRMESTRRDKTVFIFVGDNGTVSSAISAPYDTSHAKRTLYEQGTRIPLLVWGPPSLITSPGRTCDHLVSVVDVFSTVLDLCQVDDALWNPGNATKIDGRSFTRALRDPGAQPVRDHTYQEIFLPLNGTLGGSPAIDPAAWKKSYKDGIYKVIAQTQGTVPPYQFYRIDSTVQPASGQPGYLELSSDNLYPLVGTSGQEILTARFQALLAGMNALLSS